MIPPASFDVGDGNTTDIFAYYRKYYNTSNPHMAGVITITASSTLYGPENDRANVSTLISEPDGTRWVSKLDDKDPFFKIDFHRSVVDLQAYSIETSGNYRYIKTWNLYGLIGSRMVLIDSKTNATLCETTLQGRNCIRDTITPFRVEKPGLFHAFKFVHTGLDSNNERHLSMSRIRFYGTVNTYFHCRTLRTEKIINMSFFVIFLFS